MSEEERGGSFLIGFLASGDWGDFGRAQPRCIGWRGE